jgi:OmpA-OmpF porin, OOP family
MTSKKYAILAGFMALFSVSGLQAQETNSGMYRGGGYDFNDSSLIPKKGQSQQKDFLNGQYDFPSKPRNQWEIGISVGALNVSGDVRSKNILTAKNPMQTLGWGLHVRKAWGYVISTRLEFLHGTASGFNYQSAEGYWGHGANPLFNAGYFNSSTSRNAHYNYKTTVSELSFQMIAALNNLKFHKARNKFSLYALGGVGAMLYNAKIDMKDKNKANANYDFSSIPKPTSTHIYTDRKDINKALKSLFDGEYETPAERHDNRGWSGDNTFRPTVTAGLGVQFRLGKRMSISLEDRWIYTNDDLVDGMRWQELPSTTNGVLSSSAMTRDYDNINYLSLGLNYNLGGKSVDPLWWMNPMDYGYNEMKRANDADGDGISDCFDRCPNTPGGVSVDSHGCPFDTDGDGVADYKDKQLITPTECQPVDADGVGKCPDPACCTHGGGGGTPCSSISSGSVNFASGSAKLSSGAMSQLNTLAGSMRSNPNCKAVIIGCGNGSKIEQQRSWDRVNSVINYMVDKQGIDRERFIFQYGTACDASAVEYRSAGQGEEGPSNTPPPFPNLRKN